MHPHSPVLSHEEVEKRLNDDKSNLHNWFLEDGHLCRRYRTHGWKATLMVVNTIGHLAEAAWHHPDLLVSYDSLTVKLMTHSAGGLTAKDLALAHKIESVIQWQPAHENQGLDGTPTDDPAHAYIRYDVL